MTDEKIQKLLAEIERRKTIIANERDALRTILEDLDEVVDTLDRGIDGLENGVREIEHALDAVSELL